MMRHPPELDRRHFLKHFALSTAVTFGGGGLWTARVLAEMNAQGVMNNKVRIKVSDYPGLEYQFGAVRFAFAVPEGARYPFSLNRADENTFYAVDTRCTHANCTVEAFDGALSAMACYCHGSQYDIMGRVTRGPAMNDLLRYPTTFDGVDTVTVEIPGLDLKIRSVQLASKTATTARVQLDFPTLQDVYYRVYFRQEPDAVLQEIPVATTPAGPATQTPITGTGAVMTVYADAALPSGFFSVGVVFAPG